MDEVEWEKFKVSEIFTVNTGSLVSKDQLTNGRFPRITASDHNNGIGLYTSLSCDKKQRWSENVVSYSFLGASFFHPYKCSFDMKIHFLSPKSFRLDQNTGLFISSILKHFIYKPSYGYQVSKSDLSNKYLLLPVNNRHKPDWHYMEQYIINEIEKHRVPELEEPKDSPIDLHSVEWKPFKIANIFRVFSGVRLTEREMAPGRTPFIGATDCNNGITNWTATKNQSTDKNVLGINYNGSVGSVFYHPYVATFSDDVKRLHLKEPISNIYIGLFLKVMLEKQSKVYGYGYKFNFRRILAQKILLPVTDLDQPNWQFMEDYIKSIPNSKLI